jgi:hypothetical protein
MALILILMKGIGKRAGFYVYNLLICLAVALVFKQPKQPNTNHLTTYKTR